MRPIGRSSLAFALGLALLAAPARADLLEFRAGGRVRLPAEVVGDEVILHTPDGPHRFARDDFRSIVPGPEPSQEWPSRRDAARSGDSPARYEAAWWALLNGLTPEAEAMLRAAHRADPRHQPTARMIALLDRLAATDTVGQAPPPPIAYPGAWRIATGKHVVLHHQHTHKEAAERIDLLERVTTSYYLFLAAYGFDLAPPIHPLASVWFANRRDYRAALDAEGAGSFQGTRGYYHPTRALVLTYDANDDPGSIGERAAPDRPPPDRPDETDPASADRRDLDRRRLLRDLRRRALNDGTAAHEMVHQLVAASGFAPRTEAFPLWLHEGFAAQFEVVEGGRWAGIGRPHPLRIADWPEGDKAPRLAPLLRDEGFGRGYRPDCYAAAWSLVDYLRRDRPTEFLTFLDLLRNPRGASQLDPDRPVSAFLAAFGPDLPALESRWHRHFEAIRDQYDPPALARSSSSAW